MLGSFQAFFSRKICQSTSCLHHLLPPPRDPTVTSRLREPTLYPRPSFRTKRYCSTVMQGLLNFQQSCVSCVLFYISIFVLSAALFVCLLRCILLFICVMSLSRSNWNQAVLTTYLLTLYIHTTTDNLEWPWMIVSSASCTISTVAELLVFSSLDRNDRALVAKPRPVARIKTGCVAQPITDADDVTGLWFATAPDSQHDFLHMAGAQPQHT